MSRKSRIISKTGVYHIMLRSINQQQIFEDDNDFKKFLFVLSDTKKKYPFELYAYCLMGNHVHLLMATDQFPLMTIFQSIGARFVYWYNQKYKRYGHLFQDRFISYPVEDEDYFLTVLQYIHENPIRAHICKSPLDYRWSSCRIYFGKRSTLIKKEPAIKIAGSLKKLQLFFYTHQCEMQKKYSSRIPFKSDIEALNMIKEISNTSNPSEFQRLPKIFRDYYLLQLFEKGLAVTQISRLCGIPRGTIYNLIKKSEH